MRPFLVVYATRGGHTRQIAQRIADRIRAVGHEVQLQDARAEALPPLDRYSAAILAASVHLGHHQREMVKFVRARRDELDRLPTLFLSVSLTEAAAEDARRMDGERFEAQRATHKILDDFLVETGWVPEHALPIAGALTDSAHGPLCRLVMRRLLKREVPLEPGRKVVFTNWAALNQVIDGVVRSAVERYRSQPAEVPESPAPEPPAFRTALEGAVLAP